MVAEEGAPYHVSTAETGGAGSGGGGGVQSLLDAAAVEYVAEHPMELPSTPKPLRKKPVND